METIYLSKEEFEAFKAELDKPAKINPRLKEILNSEGTIS